MTRAGAEHLEPLRPIIGSWRTSGTVLGHDGTATGQIAGSDTYSWAPGGHRVVHEVDVTIDGARIQLLEFIGGSDASGGWQMHAFSTTDSRRSCASASRTMACCCSRATVSAVGFAPRPVLSE